MNPDAAKHLEPAFPHADNAWNVTDGRFDQPAVEGMSLRDYFAAKAMQAVITGAGAAGAAEFDDLVAANVAYAVADAMLLERAK